MPMLDAFNTSTFNVVSLTSAINKAAPKPMRLGQMGLFTPKPIATRTVVLERIDQTIALLPSTAWDAPGTVGKEDKRTTRSFDVPHTRHDNRVLASDLQDVRKFGSESELESMNEVVVERLERMTRLHEVTHEWRRAGALRGVVYDSNGTTKLADLFTDFSVTETAFDFDFAGTGIPAVSSANVIRHMEDELGDSAVFTGVYAFCSRGFWDALIDHTDVVAAYARWRDGEWARGDYRHVGFPLFGINWVEYGQSVGGTPFVPANTARFVPVGVPGLFEEAYAPANFSETVNTRGLKYYAKQERMEFDMGIKLHTQSNYLPYCTIPEVLAKGTIT